MHKHVLLMEGPDAPGLIFLVTKTLFKWQCNIVRQDEYVSPDGQFFMRTLFETKEDLHPSEVLKDLQKQIPQDGIRFTLSPKKKKDIVVLCTKEHHCLSDLLTRYHFQELDCNLKAVISNYSHLEPYVNKFDIPFHTVSHEGLSRQEHEERIISTIEHYEVEYLVLAKYMRILTPAFVAKYPNRIVNIHHSFLPAFIGANPYGQAHERGVKIIGATAHFVNNDLDEGPIIAQDVKHVSHRYSAKDMAREGKETEKMVLTRALKLVFDDRVFIHGNRTVVL